MTLILLPKSLFNNSFNFGFFNTISLLIQDLFLLLSVGLPLCDFSLMIISRDFVDATSRQKQIFLLGISAIVETSDTMLSNGLLHRIFFYCRLWPSSCLLHLCLKYFHVLLEKLLVLRLLQVLHIKWCSFDVVKYYVFCPKACFLDSRK